MAAARLSTIQGILVALIVAEQARAGSLLAGIPLAREQFGFMDPASSENTDAIMVRATSDGGSGMVIYFPYPILTLGASTLNGRATVRCLVPVFLLVNPEQNERGTGGLNRDPLEVVQSIWSAVIAKARGPDSFELGSSPMGIPSDESSIRSYPIDFECMLII